MGYKNLKCFLAVAKLNFANPIGFGPELSLALSAFAEFFCAGLLILGIFPRISTALLVINMFVAGSIYHAPDPFGTKEKALLFLVVFVSLLIMGAGKYSLNKLLPPKYQKL